MNLNEAAEALWDLHPRFMAWSEVAVGSAEDLRYNVLAVCGEAGEVANVVKKDWRGDGLVREKLRDELGDVFAYWSNAVYCAGFTPDEVATRAVEKAAAYVEKLEAGRLTVPLPDVIASAYDVTGIEVTSTRGLNVRPDDRNIEELAIAMFRSYWPVANFTQEAPPVQEAWRKLARLAHAFTARFIIARERRYLDEKEGAR